MKKHMDLPALQPGSPGMFRCTADGMITELFVKAGLKNTSQKEISGKMNCKTIDIYLHFMMEVVAPVVAVICNADAELKAKIKNEVYQKLNQKIPKGNVRIDTSAFVVWGEK